MATGHDGNVSAYICGLVRRDQQAQRRERLRGLLEEGLGSGPATPDTDADWTELREIAGGVQ